MERIVEMTLAEVQACNFHPEPHTVALKDYGAWFGYEVDGQVVAVACVCDKKTGKYVSECFTLKEFRGKGYLTAILKHICELYANCGLKAHCLASSRNVFEKAGFVCTAIRPFKYGTQWHMKLEGKQNAKRKT